MLLIEFPVVWRNNYNDEEQKEYSLRFEDSSQWPEKMEDSKMTIDMHKVNRFNPSDWPGILTVKVGDERYLIKMSYLRFRKLMDYISKVYTPDQYLLSQGNDAGLEKDPDTNDKS